jgi:hypothetical protein
MAEKVEPGGVTLSVWPNRLYALPVAIFTFLWLRFLWRWYALILLASADDARGFLLVFGLPFLLAGMSLLGTSIRLLTGRSFVSLDALRLHAGERLYGAGAFGTSWRRVLTTAPVNELVLPTTAIIDFVAETAVDLGDEDHELDYWSVRARMVDGTSRTLPVPVRTFTEATLVADRLNRALIRARTPRGYRDAPLPS